MIATDTERLFAAQDATITPTDMRFIFMHANCVKMSILAGEQTLGIIYDSWSFR